MSDANSVGSHSVSSFWSFLFFLKEAKKHQTQQTQPKLQKYVYIQKCQSTKYNILSQPFPNVKWYIIHRMRGKNDLSDFSSSLILLSLRSNLWWASAVLQCSKTVVLKLCNDTFLLILFFHHVTKWLSLQHIENNIDLVGKYVGVVILSKISSFS